MDAIKELKKQGVVVCSIEQVENSISLPDYTPEPIMNYALVLGNEVKGVQQSVVDESDVCIEIPQYGTKHSFNVSVTTGIVLWEFFRKIGL